MKAVVAGLSAILGVGALIAACEDAEEFEITGPALEEVLAATQTTSDGSSGLNIRGTSARIMGGEPLVFIDGVLISEDRSEFDAVDPDDIEKISVIKGIKAVEVYGPDAQYGVILITLKDSVSKREDLR